MNVICFSDITWNFLWQRQQQITSRLPKDWNIVFVEPSFWLSLAWKIIRKDIFIPHKTGQNIRITSIVTIPFGDRFRPTRKINDYLLGNKVKKIAEEMDATTAATATANNNDLTLLFYKPRYSSVIKNLRNATVCYDIIDDTSALRATPDWVRDRIQELETDSDIIITSSKKIFERMAKKRDDVHYIGNGVDVNHFFDGSHNAKKRKKEGRQVIGYTGAIGEWFDMQLLERLLTRFPAVRITLVGWIFQGQRKTLNSLKKRYKNLETTGLKPYDRLPKIVQKFDVCIIPFKIYRLTESVNPVKVYEYFAAQKPVVTTALPELCEYKDALYFSESSQEFLENVRRALDAADTAERDLQLEIAKENDWDQKAAEMTRIILEYIKRSR